MRESRRLGWSAQLHPVLTRARLEQNDRAWLVPQHGREPRPARDDPAVRDRSMLQHNPLLLYLSRLSTSVDTKDRPFIDS